MMSLFKKAKDGIVSGIGMAYEHAEHSVLGTLSRRHPDIDEIFTIIDGIKEEQVGCIQLLSNIYSTI
jgi:hypothetical protein